MNTVALIVEHDTPDLLALCLASLKRFAPEVRPLVLRGYEGAAAHAVEIEAARRHQKLGDAEIVILLDTDVVILSEKWLPYVESRLKIASLTGGLRHRGDVTQVYCDGALLVHAHCLAMHRGLFERIESFHARGIWDTAWQATMRAKEFAGSTALVPQSGLNGWPSRVGLYFQPHITRAEEWAILWAHLGRGTSFRPRGPWRERLRRTAAALGSKRAQKILSYQQDRAAFLRKGWEIVRA